MILYQYIGLIIGIIGIIITFLRFKDGKMSFNMLIVWIAIWLLLIICLFPFDSNGANQAPPPLPLAPSEDLATPPPVEEEKGDFEKFLKQSHHPEIRKYMNKRLFRQFSIAHGRLDRNDYDLCFPMQDLYEGTIS